MTEHTAAHEDHVNHPYRVQCSCGEWCYDFAAHLVRVTTPPHITWRWR